MRRTMLGDRILLLAPHPDDEIVGCGTAMRRARAAGSALHVLFLTNGVPPIECFWPWQRPTHASRIAIRWQEAMRSARHNGFAVAGRHDAAARTLKDYLGPASALIRAAVATVAPDAVWVPAYEGGHQDHDIAHFLAADIAADVPVWEFAEYNYAGGHVHASRFPAPRGDECEIVPDAAEIDAKFRALKVYRSERRNLRHCPVERECFRRFAAADYDRPPHAGTLFYQRFQWVPRHPRIDRCRPAEVSAAIRAWTARRNAPARIAARAMTKEQVR